MRILVTGSRDWTNWNALNEALLDAAGQSHDIVVIHGTARGADTMADRWAIRQGVQVERYPADWERLGKRAGYYRNAEMVARGADICLAFIRKGSRGATMCADLAEKAGIPTRRFKESR